MAYATVENVQATNSARGTYTASTTPTATAVAQFLDEASSMIDGALEIAGYSVPVPDTAPASALLMLQQAASVGACYMVEASAVVSPKLDMFKKMWDDALTMLRSADLPGVARSQSRMPRQSKTVYEPEFTRDMVL